MDQEIERLPLVAEVQWQKIVAQYEKQGYTCRSLLGDQLEELTELAQFDQSLAPKKEDQLGVTIVYAWQKKVLRVLPQESFMRLLSSRNRNLITTVEQRAFSGMKVAVAGLSVGSNICRVMTMQGGPLRIAIADADELSTSNLNRVSANLFDIGEKKTYALTRWLQSVNPYLDVRSFDDGISEENIADFVKGADVIFDEIDSLYLKLALRHRAKKMARPLVMITDNGDNVMVDIERYDKDPQLQPFHGLLSKADLALIDGNRGQLTPQERVMLSLKIVQPHNAVGRMQDSLLEVGKSLNTWPQLGTAANLAGVVGSYIVRKLALDEPLVSGRHHVSVDEKLMLDHRSLKHQLHRRRHTRDFIAKLRRGHP